MIDWHLVLFGTLWISGLSLGLATLGAARYAAIETDAGIRATLDAPRFQIPLNGGMMLFCLGLVGSADPLWERIVWVVLALLFALQVVAAWRRRYIESREERYRSRNTSR